MIQRTIHINDWEVRIFFCITKYSEGVLEDALRWANAPISVVVRMREIARDDEYNTGFTYSSALSRRSVVVIGKALHPREFLDTIVHEFRHLTDDISKADGIPPRGEAVAYLEGDIVKSVYDIIGRFICPSCRRM